MSGKSSAGMWNEPAYSRVVSMMLSKTLDELGMDALTVRRRRHTYLYREHLYGEYYRYTGRDRSYFHFGSQTEGATTHGLHSDLDTLVCLHAYPVVQDPAEIVRGKVCLLMFHDNTEPGYCHLQILGEGALLEKKRGADRIYEHCVKDRSGRLILKNTCNLLPVPLKSNVRHGPAMCGKSEDPGFMDTDVVWALQCGSWPRQAEEFKTRRRRHGWPSRTLVQKATENGVFLVPVGHKLSPKESLEWRISASQAERCIFFSLSRVHIKCYVVLKMVVKTFVEPHLSDCISSYHCKTAMFHCTESTEPAFWRDDNLLQCVLRCCELLLTWVSDMFCPHFVISGENLFAGKVTAQNRRPLKAILSDFVKSGGMALLNVQIDNLGQELQTKLTGGTSFRSILSIEVLKFIGELETCRHEVINHCSVECMAVDKGTNPAVVIPFLYRNIRLLKARLATSEKHQKQALQTLIDILSSWFGSLLVSLAMLHKKRIPRAAVRLQLTRAQYDIAALLKLSGTFYCKGQFLKLDLLLERIEDHLWRNAMHTVCECYVKYTRWSPALCIKMLELKGKRNRASQFAHCVKYSRQEIHCVPHGLKAEMYRAIGDDVLHRDRDDAIWMDLAAVDCMPYMFYLQYLTFRRLGKPELRKRSLRSLDKCIRENYRTYSFGHRETGLNLLGQCMELEGRPDDAMVCYRESLGARPRNNAANWHMTLLCNRLVNPLPDTN